MKKNFLSVSLILFTIGFVVHSDKAFAEDVPGSTKLDLDVGVLFCAVPGYGNFACTEPGVHCEIDGPCTAPGLSRPGNTIYDFQIYQKSKTDKYR